MVVLSVLTAQAIREMGGIYQAELPSLEANKYMSKYGNLNTTGTADEFVAKGFEWGDIVQVYFLDQKLELPDCTNLFRCRYW